MSLIITALRKRGAAPAIPYRYFRVYITANNGDTYTAIQQMELATSVGGADITTGFLTGGAYYNGSDDGHYNNFGFTNVLSNDFTNLTGYLYITDGTPLPHWGYVDLATPVVLAQFKMWSQYYAGGATRAPKDFLFQGSNNATTWTTIKSFTNITGWAQGTGKTFVL